MEILVDDLIIAFYSNYYCCFIWMDIYLTILLRYLYKRVDEMGLAGIVDEKRNFCIWSKLHKWDRKGNWGS